MRIRTGDTVEITTGNDAGQRGKVLKIDNKHGRVVVEGMNRVFKHLRKSQKNPQGGRLSKEMPIQVSNVALVCTSCGKATRTGVRVNADGSKDRVCKKCGAANGRVSTAKKKTAQAGK